jgi:predicted RND superfamily exporter protein
MGQLLTVGVILTLVCNLVVLPALLDLRHRSGEAVPRRRGRPPAAEASAGGSAGPGA